MSRALLLIGVVLALYANHIRHATWVYEDAAARIPVEAWRPRVLPGLVQPTTPQAAHALSVGLHLIVVGLLAVLVSRLGFSRDASWLTAAVTAVHPLTVQAVAYAAAASELWAAIGVLIAVWSAAGTWWRWPHVLGMVAGSAFAFLSKESGVVVVALVPLTWLLRAKAAKPPEWAWAYGSMLMFLCAITGLSLLSEINARALVNIGELPGYHETWSHWLLLQAAAAHRLMGQALWPSALTVDFDYDLVPLASQWLAIGVLAGLVVLTVSLARSKPLVAYGLAWMLVTLAPRLVIQTPRSYLNEHQFYVPLMGLIVAGVALFDGWQLRDGRL